MRLIVMRHAKSAWDTGAANDHARPLNGRGRRDAPIMAALVVARGWVPERVISSDSQRTIETWERMSGVFPGVIPVTFTRALYHAGVDAIQQVIEALDGERTVMLLGHNPGFEEAVDWLSDEYIEMKTANAALLSHRGDSWSTAALDAGGWRLEALLRP